jgi:hypothetical protein
MQAAQQAAQQAAAAGQPSYQDRPQAQPGHPSRSPFEPPAPASYQGQPSYQSQPAYAAAPGSAGQQPSFQGRPSYQQVHQPALPTAAQVPTQDQAPAAPAVQPVKTQTTHGLPKRVPLARLPAEAMDDTPEAASPAERDPSRVSASMVAYARGIGGRGAPGSAPQAPYTPPSSNGTF